MTKWRGGANPAKEAVCPQVLLGHQLNIMIIIIV